MLRTGRQSKALPRERFGRASAVHKHFLQWEVAGVFEAIREAGLAECDQMEGISWRWQSIDGDRFRAPLAHETMGCNPTGREKKGKQATPTGERSWRPVVARPDRGNEHDSTQLDVLLQAIMVMRRTPSIRCSKHLCADAAYRGRPALEIIKSHGYILHVVGRRTEAKAEQRGPTKNARRRVVEVCHSWFNRFRKLLARQEKLERSFVALNHIAAAMIAFRKVKSTVDIA